MLVVEPFSYSLGGSLCKLILSLLALEIFLFLLLYRLFSADKIPFDGEKMTLISWRCGTAKKVVARRLLLYYIIRAVERQLDAPVAQLDRVPDYESGGCGFESLRARHIIKIPDFIGVFK